MEESIIENQETDATKQEAAPATEQTKQDAGNEKPAQEFLDKYANIPEKFRVFKEGTDDLDIEATLDKVSGSYQALEKMKGSPAPESVDGYKYTPPEGFEEAYDPKDPMFQEFITEAHKAGMNNAQLNVAMNAFYKVLPDLFREDPEEKALEAETGLREVWKDDATLKANSKAALDVTNNIISKLGIDVEAFEASGLGNNPLFIRMMHALHGEFKEDGSAGVGAQPEVKGVPTSDEEYQLLIRSPAYMSASDPGHALAVKQAMAYRNKTHPNVEQN